MSEPSLQQPRPVVTDQPVPAEQPHWSGYVVVVAAAAEDVAAQSVLPKAAWQLPSSDSCVIEPGLQQPRPVVTDQPVPAEQPHLSLPPTVQSVFPRVTWHDEISES